jgi:regulator of nucleoside diphosphate kinase
MTTITTLPRITIRSDDYEKLSAMAAAEGAEHDVAQVLSAELARARVVPPERIGPDVVTMNATVEFRDETTGRARRVTLVYPEHADILANRLSVMTPVGAALIGLAVGDSIEWQTRDGEWRTLTVLDVVAFPTPASHSPVPDTVRPE